MGKIIRNPSVDFVGVNCKKDNQIIPYLVEVNLPEPTRDSYLTIKETLKRVGIASSVTKTLFQTCHILSKRGRFYICHFKFLFALDGKMTDITTGDIARQNKIIDLLEQWGLLEVVDKKQNADKCGIGSIKIIKHGDKKDWDLQQKYIFKNEVTKGD